MLIKRAKFTLLFVIFTISTLIIHGGIKDDLPIWLSGSILHARVVDYKDDSILTDFAILNSKMKKEYGKDVKNWNRAAHRKLNREIYKNELEVDENVKWQTYPSAIRFPIYIGQKLDQLFCFLFNKKANYSIHINTIYFLLSCLVLFSILLWIYIEFGIISALLVALNSIFFIFNFGWFDRIWYNLLPMTVLFLATPKLFNSKHGKLYLFLIVVVLAYFISINTYEWVPTLFVSLAMPVFYYSVKFDYSFLNIIKWSSLVSFAAIIGLILGLMTHFKVLTNYSSSEYAKTLMLHRVQQRTYNNETDDTKMNKNNRQINAAKTPLVKVLRINLNKTRGLFNVTFDNYLYAVGICWLLTFLFIRKKIPRHIFKKYSLICILMVLGFIGGISRLVVFKSHAAITAHQRFVMDSFNYPYDLFTPIFLITTLGLLVYSLVSNEKYKKILEKYFFGFHEADDTIINKSIT